MSNATLSESFDTYHERKSTEHDASQFEWTRQWTAWWCSYNRLGVMCCFGPASVAGRESMSWDGHVVNSQFIGR